MAKIIAKTSEDKFLLDISRIELYKLSRILGNHLYNDQYQIGLEIDIDNELTNKIEKFERFLRSDNNFHNLSREITELNSAFDAIKEIKNNFSNNK